MILSFHPIWHQTSPFSLILLMVYLHLVYYGGKGVSNASQDHEV